MTETIERNSILACYFTQAKLELAKDGNEQLCVLMELFRSKGSTDIYMKSLPSNSVKKLTLMGKNSSSFVLFRKTLQNLLISKKSKDFAPI